MRAWVGVALDVDAWRDDLVGGRVVHVAGRWMDVATARPVSLCARLIDRETARQWSELHQDALDAWVLARGLGWVGVRLDALAAEAPVLARTVTLRAALGDVSGAPPRDVTWREAASLLRRAGVVPMAREAVPLLSTRPARWWGTVGIPDGGGPPDTALAEPLRAFRANGGQIEWLPVRRPCRRARRARQETTTMRDTEVLDVLDRLEQASDDREAVRTLCHYVVGQLGAARAGVRLTDGRDVVTVGEGAVPSAVWSAAVRDASPARGTPEACPVVTVPVVEEAAAIGDLWASWPPTADVPTDAATTLGVCARLVGPRLAGCAWSVPPAREGTPRLVGEGPAMTAVREHLARAARCPFPVLLLGESGSGKELAARTVHDAGSRRVRRFVAVNCAALPDELVEAEFFGHVRGAFTGAMGDRAGVFEEADGGTLFLDEVGDLSLRAQAKLLRVLQDGEVRRVGENHPRRVDVRVIAATNVALDAAVDAGRFRADLYYRLAVVCVRLPPLRERREDIPALVAHLWAECARRAGTQTRLHPRLVEELVAHDWPGNVRELQNMLAAIAVDAPRRGVIGPQLRQRLRRAPSPHSAQAVLGRAGLEDARRRFDETCVREAMARAGGRRSEAARHLGLTRQGLSKLVRRLGLDERLLGPDPG